MEHIEDDALIPAVAPDDDRRLLRAFLSGEAEATAVLDGWVEVVLRAGFRALEADWPDVRQEIRVRILTGLRAERFKGASSLRTYVHRIAKNTAIDFWRASRRQRESTSLGAAAARREDPTAGALSRVISRDVLRKMLAMLTPQERLLLDLVHAQHLSYSEIAALQGVAEGTVKARVFRCRERLILLKRRLLEEEKA